MDKNQVGDLKMSNLYERKVKGEPFMLVIF